MEVSSMMTSAADGAGEPLRLLILEFEAARREELQRIRLEHFEKVRQIESGRLRAEEEAEAFERRFNELSDLYRNETARLYAELEQARDEVLKSAKLIAEKEKRLIRVRGIRDELYRDRSNRLEQQRNAALRDAQALLQRQAEQGALTAELAAANESGRQLELIRLELSGRVAALEGLRDGLQAQRRDLRERLQAVEARGAQDRQRLETEKMRLAAQADCFRRERTCYQAAMVAAEQRLRAAEAGLSRRLGKAMAAGFTSWKGFAGLPGAVWAAWRDSASVPYRDAPRWLGRIEEVFMKHGGRSGEDFVRIHAVGPVELATGLTQLARLVAQTDALAALPFAMEAAQADPRPFRRKWLAFMSFEAGHVESAHDLLASLPDEVEFKASEKSKAEYIAGCHRLLHGALAVPAARGTPEYLPVSRRILYVAASSLPYHVTGYTLRTHGLLGALTAEGFDVRCVTRPGYPADRDDSKEAAHAYGRRIDGISYETLPGPHRRKVGLDTYLLKSAQVLAKKAREERAAVIHAASNYESALPALLAARMLGIPFIYEVRGLWEYTSAAKKIGWEQTERFDLDRQLESLTAKHSDHVLTLTGALSDELSSRGVEKSRITLAPNAIDAQAFSAARRNRGLAASLGIQEDHFVIGYAGSVVSYEGLDDLIEALFLLKGRLSQARVLIVGDGDALPGLRELAQARGVADRVICCGKVVPASVRDYYALMNAVALPRKPVTVCQLVSPLKPLEAMALGIPLIVSSVAALREIAADGKTALIHLAGNARSLADSIELLAKTPALRSALAENARSEVAANRSWMQVTGAVAGLYRRLVHASNVAIPVEEGCDLTPNPLLTGGFALDQRARRQLDLKLKFALTRGERALGAFLSAQCADAPKRLRALVHLRAAQVCLDAGEVVEALALGETALGDDQSITSLRGGAKLFYNAARLDMARDLATQLERKLGDTVRPSDRKFIDEVLGRAWLAEWAGLPAQPRAAAGRPRRVLNILAFSLPYASMGYATRSHGLALGIRNAGWDIQPYTRPGFPYDFNAALAGQSLPDTDRIDGLTYGRILDFSRKEMNEVEYMLAAIGHYERVIRAQEPTIVHAASNYVTALPALIAAKRLGVPFVYEVRGFWEVTRSSRDSKFENTAKCRFMQLFEALTARHANRVITITAAMKDALADRGVPEERIAIAYNSVDPERFAPRAADQELAAALGIPLSVPVIGYVGSFVDYEGLDDLVRASAGLKAAGRDFRLLLVGDGAVFDDLKRQVEAAGMQDKTIMTGRVPHDKVENYYTLIDITPFPRKPWAVCELVSPLKPYEAMALEKAVIVSGNRALEEIVTHGQNGLVFAKGDVADLQRKLDELLTNPQRRADLGRCAREWICRERSWDAAGRVCAEVYERAAEDLME